MENKISDNIYWVGVHFPEPAPGGSLNAFLIKDEKTVVIDTGAPATAQYVLGNIKKLVDPTQIDYVVLTHADVDHAGGLATILAEAPRATVVVSEGEGRSLGAWGVQPQVKTVKDGDSLSLGQHNLRFVAAPFSCAPGTVLVFEETKGILFAADLFACPGPTQWQIFADADETEMLKMMQKMKLGNTQYTKQSLEKVKELPVKIIASGHGAMINTNIKEYIDALLIEVA
jgi:flavorubredoxin